MSAANYQDLPCLTCCTRGCADIVDDAGEVELVEVCLDCSGEGYLNAEQAESQRAAFTGAI